MSEQELTGQSDLCPGCGWSEKKVFQCIRASSINLAPLLNFGGKKKNIEIYHRPS